MGLTVIAKGMQDFNLAYSTYMRFRAEIIRKVYGEKCYEMFTRHSFERRNMTQQEINEEARIWESISSPELDLFLLHSDCDGHFTPKECKTILKALEPISIDFPGWDFDRKPCNMLDQWKRMFRHCIKRRVYMWYC